MSDGKIWRYGLQGLNKNFGPGAQSRPLPQKQTMRFDNFELGLNMTDDPEGISRESVALAVDLEIDERGRIVRAPGTTLFGTFYAVYEPKVMFVHHTTFGFDRLIFLDRIGNIGQRPTGFAPTLWSLLPGGLGTTVPRFSGVGYGDRFIFSDGIFVWSSGAANTVLQESTVPAFEDATVAEGRLFVVKGSVVQWSGVNGFYPYQDFSSITSGGEQLISPESLNKTVAIRAMGLDFTAIFTTDGIWRGTPTGDPTRPLDFQRRVIGAGCVSKETVQATPVGLIYLSEDGVHLFDGNNAPLISQAINKDLLPLNIDPVADTGVSQYRSSYNPVSQRYYLHTNTATYVFDIMKQRWFKRSLICYGGVLINGLETESMFISPLSQLSKTFLFLGLEGVNTNTEYEDYDSLKYFGTEFTPFYEGPTSIDPSSKNLKMVSAVKVTYSGHGTLQLYLQNQERQYEEAGPPIPLTLSTDLREEKITFLHTGELLGLKFAILNGKLEIAALELDWIPRGPNFSGQIRRAHFERAADGSFFITDVPGPAYGWFYDDTVDPPEIVFDDTLVGPEFAVVGYDTDGSPFIEV